MLTQIDNVPVDHPVGEVVDGSYTTNPNGRGGTSGWNLVAICGEYEVLLPVGITPGSTWWNRSTINNLWWSNGTNRWSCVHARLLERVGSNGWQPCPGSQYCDECGLPDLPQYTEEDVREVTRRTVVLLRQLEGDS